MYEPESLPPQMRGKVDVSESGCWLWTQSVASNGYGNTWDGQRVRTAHRYAYEHIVGPAPEGLVLDHLCAVKRCCNPAHLEPVTQAENMRRAGWHSPRPLRDECPTHGPDPLYLYYSTKGGVKVICRECSNEQQRRRRARARGVAVLAM